MAGAHGFFFVRGAEHVYFSVGPRYEKVGDPDSGRSALSVHQSDRAVVRESVRVVPDQRVDKPSRNAHFHCGHLYDRFLRFLAEIEAGRAKNE